MNRYKMFVSSMFMRRLRPLMMMQRSSCGALGSEAVTSASSSLWFQQPIRLKSVLRKRKTKMNKHKHRKRLKKLRNKTKHGKRK